MSRSLSLGLGLLVAGDERVRHHHRPGAARSAVEVGTHPAHRLRQRRLVAAAGQLPRRAQVVGVEVGQPVHRHRAVLVVEQDRGADVAGVGAQVDAGAVDQPRGEPEPQVGVVVAAGDDGRAHASRRAARGSPRTAARRRPAAARGRRRHRDQHQVDPLGLDGRDQVVDVRRLVLEHPDTQERPAEVPVGGVQDAHAGNGRRREPTVRRSHAAGGGRSGRAAAPHRCRRRSGRRGSSQQDREPGPLARGRRPATSAHRPRPAPRRRRRPPSARSRSRSGR